MHERAELTLQEVTAELAEALPVRELMGAAMVTPRRTVMPWDPHPDRIYGDNGQPQFYYHE